jgi:hypothetical protein
MTDARTEIFAWLAARSGDIVTDRGDLNEVADRLEKAGGLDAAAFSAEVLDSLASHSAYNSTYGARDVILDIRERLDRLERPRNGKPP